MPRAWLVPPVGTGGGPADATYVTLTTNATLSAESLFGDLHDNGTLIGRPGAGTKGRSWLVTSGASLGNEYYDDGVGWVLVHDATLGAPSAADYLVGTAQAGLSAEIVVGPTPGGELGGTWGSPTVDTVHSGSSHAATQAAAEATAAGELATHAADTTAIHGIADTANLVTLAGAQTLTNKVVTQPTITLAQGVAPAPTAEGDIQWDTDDNRLAIGDGVATRLFSDNSVILPANGMIARTAANVAAARTITGTAPIAVANGDGVAGNPTVSFDGLGLDALTDVTLTAPATGAALVKSAGDWIDGPIDLSLAAGATGVLQAASFPALTGPVTTTAGSLATSIANDAITNAMMANSAIGIAELSATGTPSATTFLRGDNSWAVPAGGGGGDTATTRVAKLRQFA